MLPNENPQPGADVSRPDIINPLEDANLQRGLDWLVDNYESRPQGEKILATLVFQLWHHIQRLDGAWRIQQDRLIRLEEDQEFARRLEQFEERLAEVERWQEDEETHRLEQNEYEV